MEENVIQEESVKEETNTAGSEEQKEPTAEDYKNMIKSVQQTLKNFETSLGVMEETWMMIAREFNIKDAHMKELGKYNEDHRKPMPEDLSEEEKEKWDHLNGLDDIPMEEVTRIFGEDSPVHGVSEEITRQHVKEIAETFFSWLMVMRQYREAHDAYLELLEVDEEERINQLKKKIDETEDKEKKAAMQESIDYYYHMKYLGFLWDKTDDKEYERILKAMNDEKKCTYWLQRTTDRLKQYKVSPKFVMEIANFEKRFTDKDYSEVANALLLYFMNVCIHSDAHDKKNPNHIKTFSMVIALDNVIRNVWKDEKKDQVMTNVKTFYDKMLIYKEQHPEL